MVTAARVAAESHAARVLLRNFNFIHTSRLQTVTTHEAASDVPIAAHADDTAISNGPLVWAQPGRPQARRRFGFGTTPPMSSQLVALAIGDLHCTRRRVGDIPLRVCAVPERRLTRFCVRGDEG
jgi:hypothetical protein